MVVNENTELRKLGLPEFNRIALILSLSENWKKLASFVTKDGTKDVAQFDGKMISIIEQASRVEHKSSAAIFLEEWATIGRKRPTLGLLLELLKKAELFRAADYLAEEVLKVEVPPRPMTGPAVPIDVEGALAESLAHQNLKFEHILEDVDSNELANINLQNIDYPINILNTESSDSDNNYPGNDNQTRFMEVRYEQSKSNDLLDRAQFGTNSGDNGKDNCFHIDGKLESSRDVKHKDYDFEKIDPREFSKESEFSDLIKFSANCALNSVGNHSDLIKFESEASVANFDERKNIEMRESMLPNFDILRTKIDKPNESSENMIPDREFIKEMSSRELPAVLKDFKVSNYFHRELTSSELPVCIKDRSGFQSTETNFSDDNTSFISDSKLESTEESRENNRKKESNAASKDYDRREIVRDRNPNDAFDSRELPVTVLEFQKR